MNRRTKRAAALIALLVVAVALSGCGPTRPSAGLTALRSIGQPVDASLGPDGRVPPALQKFLSDEGHKNLDDPDPTDWSVSQALQVRRAGIPRVTPHDLRLTAASLAISSGPNAKAVQRMLGHKPAAMTLDVYADLFEDDLDAVATAMNDAAIRALNQA